MDGSFNNFENKSQKKWFASPPSEMCQKCIFSCLEHVYMEMEHCEFQEILPLAQNYICYCWLEINNGGSNTEKIIIIYQFKALKGSKPCVGY